jgi:Spy/CpxP family protein refolding chaperone
LLAVGAYVCIYLARTSAARGSTAGDALPLAWMQTEYQLSDAQMARIRTLHEQYQPKCIEMCRRIDEKNDELQQLLAATNVITSEIKHKLAESAALRADCQTAMLQHLYEVAQVMPPDQARRYLTWMQNETLMPGMPFSKHSSAASPGHL